MTSRAKMLLLSLVVLAAAPLSALAQTSNTFDQIYNDIRNDCMTDLGNTLSTLPLLVGDGRGGFVGSIMPDGTRTGPFKVENAASATFTSIAAMAMIQSHTPSAAPQPAPVTPAVQTSATAATVVAVSTTPGNGNGNGNNNGNGNSTGASSGGTSTGGNGGGQSGSNPKDPKPGKGPK